MDYGIVVHGGAGAPQELADGCRKACERGFAVLDEGGSAVDAVTEAVRDMEDDGRFNAGSGSVLRLDGKTREMDSAVMDSEGRLGIAISLRGMANPVLVAKAITTTPHVALSGRGATNFARVKGFKELKDTLPAVLDRYERMRQTARERGFSEEYPSWEGRDIRTLWNFETPYDDFLLCDTVGAIALDKEGVFAVASSTGGASPMLLGRVGDTAMVGCGFYAGPAGAVAVTGLGEEMIRRMTAREAYDLLHEGEEPSRVCEKIVAVFPPHVPVGVIAISVMGFGIAANRSLPSHVIMRSG